MPTDNKQRYAVTLDVYVYAKDDYMARMEAHKMADFIDEKYVNARTNVTVHLSNNTNVSWNECYKKPNNRIQQHCTKCK